MPDSSWTYLRPLLGQLALTTSLLTFVSLASAQAAPPAPAPVQQPPAGSYQAPPAQPQPQQQGAYQAQPVAPPQQPYYQAQPQAYPPPPPGAYPAQGYAQPYPGQPPVYQQPYVAPVIWQRPRPRRGMMIAGASVLGGSYLLAMVVGAALIDNNDDSNTDCDDCRAVGRWLFVPVIGPFVAMSQSNNGDAGLMLLGLVQLAGAGLLTGGIIRYRNSRRELDSQGFSWKLDHDRKLSLNLEAGARSVGPRMRIDF